MRHKITDEFKKDVIDYYRRCPMTMNAVCEHFDICMPTAIKILKGVEKHKKSLIFNPSLKENFFDSIDTERKAYWLGLLISDGNIFDPTNTRHPGQKWVSITLKEDDEYILEEFRRDIGLSSKIGHDGRGSCYVAVRSDVMAKSLEKYGLKERKSFETVFPFMVDKKFYRHVIRGIIDGDGTIQACPYRSSDGRIRFRHMIGCCGTHRLMSEMLDVINENLKLSFVPVVYDYKNRSLSEFHITKINDMDKLGKWIYSEATVFLERKKLSFDLFVDHYSLDKSYRIW